MGYPSPCGNLGAHGILGARIGYPSPYGNLGAHGIRSVPGGNSGAHGNLGAHGILGARMGYPSPCGNSGAHGIRSVPGWDTPFTDSKSRLPTHRVLRLFAFFSWPIRKLGISSFGMDSGLRVPVRGVLLVAFSSFLSLSLSTVRWLSSPRSRGGFGRIPLT